jgi:hypothetical protein
MLRAAYVCGDVDYHLYMPNANGAERMVRSLSDFFLAMPGWETAIPCSAANIWQGALLLSHKEKITSARTDV